MPVPTTFADLSTTVASNSPAGSENVFPNLDDYIRFINAALASIKANTATNGWTSPYLSTTVTGINGTSVGGFRNRVINGNFAVNQRAVSGTVTLAAGVYGHDRWKAGSGGCTYTFATSNNVTTLTISAGTLQQVVEGLNLESGTYCMSWTGTATGKIGAGSLSASGVTQAVTGGTDTTIEFSTGTLSRVQLEIGSATTFEQRPYGTEFALCQRYYQIAGSGMAGGAVSTTQADLYGVMPVEMRSAPTASLTSTTPTITSSSNFTATGAAIVNGASTTRANRMFVNGFTGLTNLGYVGCITNFIALNSEL